MARLKQLIQEIHRRSLWQVLAIYVVASWAVLEAADVLVERLSLPEWVYGVAIVLLLIGLPIVLATAFVQEGISPTRPHDPTLMPSGELEADSGPREVVGARRLFTWRNAISGGVLALALWGVVATGWIVLYGGASAESPEQTKSIAVLPFTNMSDDPENEFFTAGIHDDILSQLAKISDLIVISRTSVMQYAGTKKDMRTIADELGVGTILEGSVRRAGGMVRVVTQLIDAKADAHLWSETYDRELTAANVFAIQSDIADQIARALQVALTPEEKERIDAVPTENLQAYDFYLRGNDYLNRGFDKENLSIAVDLYEEAVEFDSSFALAYAKLSVAHAGMYWFRYDATESRLARAKEAADRALELASDLPQAHVALGYYYYWGHLDYETALLHLGIAEEAQFHDSDLFHVMAAIQRRQGEWEQAASSFERAAELDPRSAHMAFDLGQTYRRIRRYPDAERQLTRAISLAPDIADAYDDAALLYVSWEGSTQKSRRILEQGSEKIGAEPFAFVWAWLDVIDGEYERAFDRLLLGPDTAAYFLRKAQLHDLMDRPELSRAHYDTARILLEGRLEVRPEFARFHSALGIAYAGLGRKEEAIAEGKRAVELLPVSKDALRGSAGLADLARIYVMVGDYDAAVERLEFLLAIPGPLSIPLLRVDPLWSPLRDYPRFQALLETYEQQLRPD